MPHRAPFAPGKRPNMLSKLWFSMMRNTTCSIGHLVAGSGASGAVEAGRGPLADGPARGASPGDEHAAATAAVAATTASRARTWVDGRGRGVMDDETLSYRGRLGSARTGAR